MPSNRAGECDKLVLVPTFSSPLCNTLYPCNSPSHLLIIYSLYVHLADCIQDFGRNLSSLPALKHVFPPQCLSLLFLWSLSCLAALVLLLLCLDSSAR